MVIFLISFLPIVAYENETEILMFLWNGETRAEEGFKDTLAKELPEQNIIYTIPIDLQIQKIQEIFGKGPIGFIYNPLDQRSVNLKENFKSYFKNIGEDLIPLFIAFEKLYRCLFKNTKVRFIISKVLLLLNLNVAAFAMVIDLINLRLKVLC